MILLLLLLLLGTKLEVTLRFLASGKPIIIIQDKYLADLQMYIIPEIFKNEH